MISPSSLRTFLGLDWVIARKALSLALAAWLSFVIAALLHVHNAYWAAMPVWVLTQPSRGLVLERSVFRIIGTVIGAAVGFALVNLPVPPYAQLVLLATWIALNAGLTHVLRGVTSYGALLAGMTAAVVVIPSLLAPSMTMELALARVDCTLIGVIVSAVVLAILTPESSLTDFYAQIRTVSAEAVAYAARILREGKSAVHGKEERRILGLISQLESSARLNAAGSVEGYRRLSEVDLLVVGSLSTMAAAQALHDVDYQCDTALHATLARIADHLRTAWNSPMPESERHIETLNDARLMHLDSAIGQILDADIALSHPESVQPRSSKPRLAWLAPHREWPLAWRTAAMAGIASFLASALGLWLKWPPAELAALGVCIFVMVLGSMPLPQLIAPKLLTGVIVGVVFGIIYRLAVQPYLTTTSGLVLTIIPFLLLGGFARANPRVGAAGVDANMCFLLASQAGMPAIADIAQIFTGSMALTVAAGIMASAFILFPRRMRQQAEDAADVIRRDLRRIIESDSDNDPADWRARGTRQILRLTLHLGRAKELGERWPKGLLAVLTLGQAMIDLQQQGMPEAVKVLLGGLLQQKMSPQQTAQALHALALAIDEGPIKPMIQQLANTLVLATEPLTLGLAN
ncbi:MAG: FUSC family protein [Formivibrio sp.]|nr:FUSC family protein [Formivibrio sp.]